MKNALLAFVIATAATAAFAGGYSDPVVTPDVVVTDTVENAGSDEWAGVLMVFMTIILLGVGG